MKFVVQSHKRGNIILNDPEYLPIFEEITGVISGISDENVKTRHETKFKNKMSLSLAINSLLKERFTEKGWIKEASIFQGNEFKDNKWRLDFAKGKVSVEVAFNHGEAIAWNLIKPVLASEQNHVKKAIQTEVGVIICATKQLKTVGAFDGAVGEFEKICRYLIPLDRILTVPMIIIGIEAPETFKLTKKKVDGRNIGEIIVKKNIISPYTGIMVNLPLYESVGCGEVMYANKISEETIPVRKDYLSGGSKYFVLKVTGDSMNKAGINDGDLVLCVKNYHPEEGNKVVALIGDDATIKEYRRENGCVILKPCSSNPIHKPLKFTMNDEIKIQGVVVRVLDKDKL